MGSTADHHQKVHLLSPWHRQLSYFSAGSLAGASSLPIEYLYRRPTSTSTFIRTVAPPAFYRTGIRFWVFDHVQHQLSPLSTVPVEIKGGLGGAAGGFVEVCAEALLQRRRHVPLLAAGTQSLKLFFCFGTYTFLSHSLAETQPPKPFWWCWIMGATAGGVGSGIVARLQGVRGSSLWARAVPRGALAIGTVISVQVTSCAEILKIINR